MSVLSYRTGPTLLVRVPAEAAPEIRPGMPLALVDGRAVPAGAMPWPNDPDAARQQFAAAFLGVAHSASGAGEGGPVSVCVGPQAVYAPPLTPGGCAFGAPLGPTDDGAALSNDRLQVVYGPEFAVARSVEAAPADAPVVRCTFASAFHPGSGHAGSGVGGSGGSVSPN